MTPGLVVVPPSSALSREGNLLVTGVNMFCIFNPRKCLQMESCHPGKCVCDLCPPLAESEWWKKKLSPSGKPAARLSISLHIALPVHKQCTTYLQKRRKSYQCSKLLHLPFSNLGFWRDVDCCRFLFQTAMSWRSVSAPCKQCLSACRVSKKLQRCGCGPDSVFVGAVNTPDRYAEDMWCAGSERGSEWSRRDETSL